MIASVPLWVVLMRLGAGERLPARPSPASASGSSAWRCCCGLRAARPRSASRSASSRRSCGRSARSFGAARDAEGRVCGDDLGDARGGVAMLPFGLVDIGSVAPSTESILAWIYLVTIGSVVGFTAYTWLLANAPLGDRLDVRVGEPGRRDPARSPLPRRAAELTDPDRRSDRRRVGCGRRATASLPRRRRSRKACARRTRPGRRCPSGAGARPPRGGPRRRSRRVSSLTYIATNLSAVSRRCLGRTAARRPSPRRGSRARRGSPRRARRRRRRAGRRGRGAPR